MKSPVVGRLDFLAVEEVLRPMLLLISVRTPPPPPPPDPPQFDKCAILSSKHLA